MRWMVLFALSTLAVVAPALGQDGAGSCRATPEVFDASLTSAIDGRGVFAVWDAGMQVAWTDGSEEHWYDVPRGWSVLSVHGARERLEGLARHCSVPGRLGHLVWQGTDHSELAEVEVTRGRAVLDAERNESGWGVLLEGQLLDLDYAMDVVSRRAVRARTRHRCGDRRTRVGTDLQALGDTWVVLRHGGEWYGSIHFVDARDGSRWRDEVCVANPVALLAYEIGRSLVVVESLRHLGGWRARIGGQTEDSPWPSLEWELRERQAEWESVRLEIKGKQIEWPLP